MDFAALPPEVNSALIYSGPGSGPLMAAASAWTSLADELATAADSYQSVLAELSGEEWLGPASTSMATAAAPYIAWMTSTAAQVQHAAGQAAASAAAYESAFAMTVPPAVIAANRAQLAALVATNFLGQNTPAIAATEAQYGEMWAQDAAAMYGYAASSAAAGKLTPLTSPNHVTNPAGLAGQAAAVTHAAASATSNQTGLIGLISELPSAVESLASPLASAVESSPIGAMANAINNFLGIPFVSNVIYNVGVTLAWNVAMMTATFPLLGHFIAAAPAGFTVSDVTPLDGAGLSGGMVLASAAGPAGAAGFVDSPVLAAMGSAPALGGLSVPASWSAAAPGGTGAVTLAGTGWTAAADEGTSVAGVPAGMSSPPSAGRGGFGFGTPRYGFKPTIMPKKVLV
ncbi:PPE family protein [Mycobacterium botniense]|uniref:PPE family protein PPE43 n=1 Tax=Mycobacterium botniense TaxID=84962 RepID=A0A7I9XYL1_9MYCO|nr:PPE family protein [Mycobacterium botniense]GFG74909.1 PPE family protein PPE43 [Mycobacterium botniense]